MLPSSWPKWILIPISLGLTAVTVVVGFFLEPAVQAIAPQLDPTPESVSLPPRLPYAAPLSDSCVECHTDETSLVNAGASEDTLDRVLLREDSVMTLHGRLGCITCHGGIGGTQNIDAAHEGLVGNPSQPEEAGTYCLSCHHDLRTEIPEHNIRTPHARILWGIHEQEKVCSCSNCHGAVAHGVEPIGTHEFLGGHCIECHEEQDVPPERLTCSGCHIGPHDVLEAMDCETCHVSTEIWSKVELAVHPMELNGEHAQLHCFDCHLQPNFHNISGFTCSDCHTKPHEFGRDDCTQCHVDGESWITINEAGFDHLTIWDGYKHHEDVDCRGCHFEGYDVELSPECSSCHSIDES